MMQMADWKTRKEQVIETALKRAARFAGAEEGGLTFFALFLLVGMLIVAGLGVDFMHYEAQRTRLQATLDRAILAGAHPDQTTDRKAVVKSYFTSAGLGDYIKDSDIKAEATSTNSEVSAKASMPVQPLLLQLAGFKGLNAVATGAAEQAVKYLEVSLVVDVSGSMLQSSTTGNSKISELRTAAKKFSNQLLCNPEDTSTSTNCTYTEKNTSLSLVPYSSQVSVGPDLLKHFTLTDQQNDSFCVTFMDADFGVAGIDPAHTLRQSAKYYGLTSSSWKNPNGWNEPAGSAASSLDTWWSCFTAPWRRIVPFEDSASDMASKISALDGLGGTAIHVGMKWGVALLMKDMNDVVAKLITDNKVTGSFSARPYDPDVTTSAKVVVLMTDGINSSYKRLNDGYRAGPSPFWINSTDSSISSDGTVNTSSSRIMSIYNVATNMYHWRNVPDSRAPSQADHPYGQGSYRVCDRVWGGHYVGYYNDCYDVNEPGNAIQLDYEEFWRAGFTTKFFDYYSFLGTPHSYLSNSSPSPEDSSISVVDQLLVDQCDAAKAAGIKVYTIELETSGGSGGATVLQKCSSGVGFYYKVDGEGLDEAFSAIGQDIVKLRLTR